LACLYHDNPLKQRTNIWSDNISSIPHSECRGWLLLQTCLLSTPFPMQKLIRVPLSEETQIVYGRRNVKRKIVIMGLQTKGTHQRATLQFRTRWKDSGRKGRQGQIEKSYHIAEDARVVGGEVKSVSCTCCTSDPQSVCWSPQMHNLFVHMQKNCTSR
jgi:hypothetical protein